MSILYLLGYVVVSSFVQPDENVEPQIQYVCPPLETAKKENRKALFILFRKISLEELDLSSNLN